MMAVAGYMSSSVSVNIREMLLCGNPEFISGEKCSALGTNSYVSTSVVAYLLFLCFL